MTTDPTQHTRHPALPSPTPVPDDRVPGDERGDDRRGPEPYGEQWLPTLAPGATDAASPTASEPSTSPAPSTPPRPRPAGQGRWWLVAGLGAALVLAGVAGVFSFDLLSGGLWRSAEKSTAYTDPVTKVALTGSSGEVTIRAGAPSGRVEVARRVHWGPGSSQPTPVESVANGTLTIDSTCSAFLSWCSVDYVVTVPAGTAVSVDNGSGDVMLSGALGATTAATGSGDLTVRGSSGPLQVRTGSGDIEATDLASANVRSETGSGSIDLELSQAADSVYAQTGSGDVTVLLPQGTYDVVTETGSGDTEVGVTDAPSGADRVEVHTGSGDIDVRYR